MVPESRKLAKTYVFDLKIHRQAEGYLARGRGDSGREAEGEFRNPFDPLEIENLWLRLGRKPRMRRPSEDPEDLAAVFGDRLFRAVFQSSLLRCLDACRNDAERDQATLLIRLGLREVPELADLPWEYLCDRDAAIRFLALSGKTPIVRRLGGLTRTRPLRLEPPLRMLVVTSEPEGYEAVDAEGEWEAIRNALRPATESGHILLDRLDRPDPLRLQQQLRSEVYHLLHFVGHGGFSEQDQGGKLVFDPADERPRLVSSEDLATLLYGEDSLRLVVLNACEGARAAPSDAFSGTAQTLVRQGIPAVIAMQAEVTDRTALELARQFYGNLALGHPIDECLAQARITIATHLESPEWGIPVLFLEATDGQLFAAEASQAGSEAVPAETSPSPQPTPEPTTTAEPQPAAPLPTATTPSQPSATEEVTVSSGLQPQVDLGLARLQWRLQGFQPMASGADLDPGLVTCAEYQFFLDADPAHRRHLPDHWLEGRFPAEAASWPVTGLRSVDAQAFCQWLCRSFGDGAWRFRLPTSDEHRQLPLDATVPAGAGHRILAVWCRDGGDDRLQESQDPIDGRCREHLRIMSGGHLRRCLALVVHQHEGLATSLSFPRSPARDRTLEKAVVRAIEEATVFQTLTFNIDPVGHLQKRLAIERPHAEQLNAELARTRGVARSLANLSIQPRVADLGTITSRDLTRWSQFVVDRLGDTADRTAPAALERCLELVRHIGHDLQRVLLLDGLGEALDRRELARQRERLDGARLALLFVAHQLSPQVSLALSVTDPNAGGQPAEARAEVERLLRAFWALALLDERLRGSHPAYECLRLARDSVS